MATDQRDPDPTDTPGLAPGGGVRPGDTPPISDSMSGAAGGPVDPPPRGARAGGRLPMIVTLVFIALITIAVLIYGIAEIAAYVTRDEVSSGTGTSQDG